MRSSLVGSLVLCLVLLAGCESGGPSGPSAPTFGGLGGSRIAVLDPGTGTLLQELSTTQVTFGIAKVTEEDEDGNPTNGLQPIVVQDMVVGLIYPDSGGRLQIDIVNFSQRRDLRQLLDASNSTYEQLQLSSFNPVFDNDCPGGQDCVPILRATWWPTAAALEGQENIFFSKVNLAAQSSLTVERIAGGQLQVSFDLLTETESGDVQMRLRSTDSSGNPGPIVADLSAEPGQPLGPVAVVQAESRGGLTVRFRVTASVDPDEETGLERFWVDADQDGTPEPTCDGLVWNDLDPTLNFCEHTYPAAGNYTAQATVEAMDGAKDLSGGIPVTP